jgi:hypothetical protein
MSSEFTVVCGGRNCLLVAYRLVGSDMDIVNIYILFIFLYLETISHTVSHTISLYHYITVSIGKRGDIALSYYRNIPPVDIEVHTTRFPPRARWGNISPVHANRSLHNRAKVSQMIPSVELRCVR